MIPVTTCAERTVAVFGLGGSGLVTAQALKAGGANVIAWDDSAAKVAAAADAGISVADLRGIDWSPVASLVLSPGVPLTHPEPHWSVVLADEAGVEIIGDVELFCRERRAVCPKADFVAITGTNGKSTTTALTAHILREAGGDVQMGGNIGTAILSLDPFTPERIYVVECSSFQIDLAPSLDPSIGVLLNITPDHLDRHGTMENYAAIKKRLVASAGVAIVATEDNYTRRISVELLEQGQSVMAVSSHLAPNLDGINSLRGAHNAQNAAAAFAVARELGLDEDRIVAAMRTFPGLPHRMEQVARAGHVLFINDSKATNADSTEKALLSFAGDIFWILGGKAKEGGIAPLEPYFPKIAKAYLIGDAAETFAATLDGKVPYERCGTLDRATARAAADAMASAAAEPVVLLSPACASYDQFPNFEVRGKTFRDLVNAWLAARAA